MKNFYKVISKKFLLLLSVLSFVLFSSCENILNLEDKPSSIERLTTFQIRLIDKSGYMKKLFGNDYVRDAEITLKSNTLTTEYKIKSDSTGLATISGIVSDTYILTSTRIITEDEMEIITGVRTKNHKLTNTKISLIELRADIKNEIELPMELVVSGSPLVISEIYACGPPGSGLYYHDKYVEVYNQTDSTIYLDGIIVAVVYSSSYLGQNYVDDPEFVHSKSVWIFPGTGKDFPLAPGEYAVCAEDAIDHRINAPNSVDLSQSKFEFYKDDAPDVDNPNIPNMIKIYQTSGNDWLIGGETGALVIAKYDVDSIKWYDDQMLIPYTAILDGVEYMKDPSQLNKKILNHSIDGGTTGGIQFYTGKSMERILIDNNGKKVLKDDNNSSLDFMIIPKPTPQFHY